MTCLKLPAGGGPCCRRDSWVRPLPSRAGRGRAYSQVPGGESLDRELPGSQHFTPSPSLRRRMVGAHSSDPRKSERSTASRQPLQKSHSPGPCFLQATLSGSCSPWASPSQRLCSIPEKQSPEASESCKEEGQSCSPHRALQGALSSVCCWGGAVSVSRRTLWRLPHTWGLLPSLPSPLFHPSCDPEAQPSVQRGRALMPNPLPGAEAGPVSRLVCI